MTNSDVIFLLLIVFAAMPLIYYFRTKRRLQKQVKEQIKDVYRFFPGSGRKLYELNTKTLEMVQIDITECKPYTDKKGLSYLFTQKEDHVYCTALNEKNAIKRFSNMVPGEFKKA